MARIRRSELPPGALAELFTALIQLHVRAGEPSMRAIAGSTNGQLSHDTVHRVFTQPEIPTLRSLREVVRALGGDEAEFRDRWMAARLAQENTAAQSERRDTDVPDSPVPGAARDRTRLERPGDDEQRSSVVRVMVVDDHPLWCDAVARDLSEAGYEVVATAGDGEEAVRRARNAAPDVVVLDLNLPGLPGVAVCREIVRADPAPRVLILSASGEHSDVLEAVKAGATGYLMKSASREEVIHAVARTADGDPVFTPGLAGRVLNEYRRLTTERDLGDTDLHRSRLTERESQVVRQVAGGLSYKQIAEQMNLSHRTIQNHVQSILKKLQLRNRTELVRYAVQHSLVDD